jgi:pyruvate kinase
MTKIIATINKNPYNEFLTEKIIKAGANVLRFNLSHNDPITNRHYMENARNIAKKHRSCKIMADIPGSKVRIAGYYKKITQKNSNLFVKEGKNYILKSGKYNTKNKNEIVIDSLDLHNLINVGDIAVLGDGETAIKIIKKGNKNFLGKCLKTNFVPFRSGVSTPLTASFSANLSEKNFKILEEMQKFQPDYITQSFVSNRKQILEYKDILKKYNLDKIPLIAKIETQEGVDNIDEILEIVDGVMVARGDLGLTSNFRYLGINQKKIIKSAKKKKKISIVSTQIMESLNTKYVPQRSDILDLTNIVLDGADMIMLCRETARSEEPQKNVEIVKNMIEIIEKYKTCCNY